MRLTTAASFALAAPLLVSAAPARFRRQSSLTPAEQQDLTVLNFANVLNQLELNFYQQVGTTFSQSDITSAGFPNAQLLQQQVQNIVTDESNHINAFESLIGSLGQQPLGGCSFDFSSALTSLPTALATARVVENVGVSAFLGAANLISDPLLLTDAGSILTTEARHSTILNVLSGTGDAIPQAFDIALTPPQVLAIAGPFIQNCNLGVSANPTLNINAPLSQGSQIQLNSSAIPSDTSNLSCQMITGGASQAVVQPFQSCSVPSNITGPVAIFVTNSSTPLVADVTQQNGSSIVAGPTLTFIDTTPQTLGTLARNVGQSAPSSSSSSDNNTDGVTVSGSNSTSVSGATTAASSACGANPADTNNAVSLGGPNTYTGPSANCVFTIVSMANQSLLTATPPTTDTAVIGSTVASVAAAAATTAITSGAAAAAAVVAGPTTVESSLTLSSTASA